MPQHRRHQKVLGHCLQQQHQAQQLLTQVHFPHQDPVQRPHIRSAHAQTDIIHHNGTCQCKLHMWHCYRPSVCTNSSSYCLKLQRDTRRQPEHMVPGRQVSDASATMQHKLDMDTYQQPTYRKLHTCNPIHFTTWSSITAKKQDGPECSSLCRAGDRA